MFLYTGKRFSLGRSRIVAAHGCLCDSVGFFDLSLHPASLRHGRNRGCCSIRQSILNYKKVGSVGNSVADPGSGAFLTPVSGIDFFWIPDPASPYFGELGDNLLGKKNSNFFLYLFKNLKILTFRLCGCGIRDR
jgi:hypothetical protein